MAFMSWVSGPRIPFTLVFFVLEDFCHVLELRLAACDRDIVSVAKESHVLTGMVAHAWVALLALEKCTLGKGEGGG